MWCSEFRTFSGPVVEPVHDVLDLLRCQPVEAYSFREIPADQTVGVFVQPSLPGMAGVSERLPADAGSIISRNAIPDTEVWYRQSRCLMWLRNIHAPKTACPGSACGVREIPSAPGAMSAL